MQVADVSLRIIRLGFYLLFAAVPFLLTPWNYELFEYNKMMAVYGLTVMIVAAWVVRMIALGKLYLARTPLDVPILLFLGSQLVSTIFSIDPHVSWFGYYSRFNGGMWSIISYTLLFYALVNNVLLPDDKDQQEIKNQKSKIKNTDQKLNIEKQGKEITTQQYNNITILLKLALASASVVALYGVAERLGIDKHLWVQDVQNRVFSTLGQPNWLAAYLVTLAPIAIAIGMLNAKWPILHNNTNGSLKRSLFSIYHLALVILFFLVLLFTRSRSGLLGFVVADALFWLLLFWKTRNFNRFRLPFIMYHVSFIIVVFLNGTSISQLDRYLTLNGWRDRFLRSTIQQSNNVTIPTQPTSYTPPLLESGGTESGVIRKYVWQAAVSTWKSSLKTKLIGTGTETFAFAFYQFKPKEHNATSEWDFLYNKAHNEYLNYLATTGLLGLGSYLLFIGAFIWWFMKMLNAKCQMIHNNENASLFSIGHLALDISLFAGWASILLTNFFGFSVVVAQLFLFLFPAMMFVFSLQQYNNITIKQLGMPSWMLWLPIVVGLYILMKLGTFWYADTLFATGYRLNRGSRYQEADTYLRRATALNPDEPFYHDEWAGTLAGLATAAVEEKEATAAGRFATDSLVESDRALAISPKNVNFWKTRTKIFYAFSDFDATFNKAAIEALEQAKALSPNDPKIYYNLAILYGREAENDKAIKTLKETIALKPNYRDAYWALYVFYNEAKQPLAAKEIVREYLTNVDPGDKDFLSRITNESK